MADTPRSIDVPVELVSGPNVNNRQVALLASAMSLSKGYTKEQVTSRARYFLEWLDKDTDDA